MQVITTHTTKLTGVTKTGRFVLKPLTDDALPSLYRWNANRDLLYWTEGRKSDIEPHDEETVREIYGSVSKEGHCFLIEVQGSPIGECWLQRMNIAAI